MRSYLSVSSDHLVRFCPHTLQMWTLRVPPSPHTLGPWTLLLSSCLSYLWTSPLFRSSPWTWDASFFLPFWSLLLLQTWEEWGDCGTLCWLYLCTAEVNPGAAPACPLLMGKVSLLSCLPPPPPPLLPPPPLFLFSLSTSCLSCPIRTQSQLFLSQPEKLVKLKIILTSDSYLTPGWCNHGNAITSTAVSGCNTNQSSREARP